MLCLAHSEAYAVGVCVHCGRGMCGVCVERSANDRMVCSEPCAAASVRFDHTVDVAVRSNRKAFLASAYSCYGLAGLCGAVGAFFLLVGLWFLALPLGVVAAFMVPMGVYFQRNAPSEVDESRPKGVPGSGLGNG